MYLSHKQIAQGLTPWANKEKIMSVNYSSQFGIREVLTAKVLDRGDYRDYIPQIRHLVEVELENGEVDALIVMGSDPYDALMNVKGNKEIFNDYLGNLMSKSVNPNGDNCLTKYFSVRKYHNMDY
tara:strand:- start:290 stop:664 length:375 start_codon:yes stop_codon:yes gene_type:complete